MQDFVGDMITRIRNGQRARLGVISLHPATPNFCLKILNILYSQGYIRGYYQGTLKKGLKKEISTLPVIPIIYVLLKYNIRGTPVISQIFRVSKSSRRVFLKLEALWKPKNAKGIYIISTTQGLLVDSEARIRNLGGEIICGVY